MQEKSTGMSAADANRPQFKRKPAHSDFGSNSSAWKPSTSGVTSNQNGQMPGLGQLTEPLSILFVGDLPYYTPNLDMSIPFSKKVPLRKKNSCAGKILVAEPCWLVLLLILNTVQ
ncbi:hypothetical protein [Nodosilinea nodulosa]|uniref:hypothetical protein n=1 Tax=Nodosilinea nodulosa TaxID=416001 RepID=UPI0012D77C62|nr:hypothetical protein [Nodosilinea nodulosa]